MPWLEVGEGGEHDERCTVWWFDHELCRRTFNCTFDCVHLFDAKCRSAELPKLGPRSRLHVSTDLSSSASLPQLLKSFVDLELLGCPCHDHDCAFITRSELQQIERSVAHTGGQPPMRPLLLRQQMKTNKMDLVQFQMRARRHRVHSSSVKLILPGTFGSFLSLSLLQHFDSLL